MSVSTQGGTFRVALAAMALAGGAIVIAIVMSTRHSADVRATGYAASRADSIAVAAAASGPARATPRLAVRPFARAEDDDVADEPGEAHDRDTALPLPGPWILRGVVVNAVGEAVAGARVRRPCVGARVAR